MLGKISITASTAILLMGAAALPAQQLTPAEQTRIDSMLARLVEMGASPSLGLVIVRDTQVVYLKGVGFADIENRKPFTPETVFYTGSTTKAFTALAAAILDRQGRLKLDDPISRYLPGLRLRPPLNPDSITIRSLVTHTHGIAGGAVQYRLAFTGEYRDNAHLIELLTEHNSALPDRNYRYSNLGYNIAGFVMDQVTGESWKETLNRLVFAPLGMRNTTAHLSRVPLERRALPYRLAPTGFRQMPYGKTDASMQSAGGLVTTLADEARWLEAHLNDGKVDGRQVLPADVIREARKTQVPDTRRIRDVQMFGYGLGWHLGIYQGDTLVHHGGGFPGFAAYVGFSPTRRIGVAAFSNSRETGDAVMEMVFLGIFDVLAGRSTMAEDSLPRFRAMLEQRRAGVRADLDRRAARSQVTPLPLKAYAGRYENPTWGSLVLAMTPEGRLEARFGALASVVEVFDGAQHQLRTEAFGPGQIIALEVENGVVIAARFDGNRYVRTP